MANKAMRSTVSEKGQVTIPKPIRERLGIRPGEVLEFDEHPGGGVVARKAATRSPVDELYGVLRIPAGTDELIERLRGEPDSA
jgi:antitoxin PrlF